MSEIYVIKRNGSQELYNPFKIQRSAEFMCEPYGPAYQSELETSIHTKSFNGMTTEDIQKDLICSAAEHITIKNPEWSFIAARGLLQLIYKQATAGDINYPPMREYINYLVQQEVLSPVLLEFDLEELDKHIDPKRDFKFNYLGLQTVTNKYLARNLDDEIAELPQHWLMRVAMYIASAESTPEERMKWAIEFYNRLSSFDYFKSTPTMFNAGTTFPQLSSCFVPSISDSLDGIFDTLRESASYSKFSGGIGLDMTPIRAQGSFIKSTKGKAGGVVPYARLYNDILLGFDQSGRRLGAGALYLEPWHADIESFLDLKNNTGDHRLRTPDCFPAEWIPDLFMERAAEDGENWPLFSPSDASKLHDLYGKAFEEEFKRLEEEGKYVRKVSAKQLFRKMIAKWFETGVYFPCFKDNINNRYTQIDSGTVRSSNLCTEITLRSDDNLTAVCNLGSINIANFVEAGAVVYDRLAAACRALVRSLDNVITVGMLPHEKGRRFNEQDRAVGAGIMGWTEALVKLGIDYESDEHIQFADKIYEFMSWHMIDASADLARERGSYPTFHESTWAKGILPIDSANNKIAEKFNLPVKGTLDWDSLREKVKGGMRNSCLMAIAPTATIANITGVTACTELPLMPEYTKENLNGKFTVVAPTLQYGRLDLCKFAMDVGQIWSVYSAAARQRWIDQSQSLNIWYPHGTKGNVIAKLVRIAWEFGVKTMYYLKSEAPVRSDEFAAMSAPSACIPGDESCQSCQ